MSEQETDSSNSLDSQRKTVLREISAGILSAYESNELATEKEKELDWGAEHARLDFDNRVEKKRRRERWDSTLLALVVVGFGTSFWIIILIGDGILKFENNAFAVPSVVAAGIVETYGLSKLAIKYFFSEDGDRRSNDKDG